METRSSFFIVILCAWWEGACSLNLCPSPEDIYPCVCKDAEEIGLELVCNSVVDREELERVTSAYFPTKYFHSIFVIGTAVGGSLSSSLFRNLQVTNYHLTYNKLREVTGDAFESSADTVETIDLADNLITIFDFRCLKGLHRLLGLWLGNNKIRQIPDESFSNPTVKTIDLNSNEIMTVGRNAFAGVPQLEELGLEKNLLTTIGEQAFRIPNHKPAGDITFVTLLLSGNKIASISNTAFEGIKDAIMYFDHNSLTTIPEEAFRPIIASSHGDASFFMGGNPLACDCRMMWIVESSFKNCFKNGLCSDGTSLEQLTVEQLGECRRKQL